MSSSHLLTFNLTLATLPDLVISLCRAAEQLRDLSGIERKQWVLRHLLEQISAIADEESDEESKMKIALE